MISSLIKRTMSHFSGLMVGKVLTTIIFIFVARSLQPEKFGELLLFITIVQLTTVLANFGLKQWYQKQVGSEDSKEENRAIFNQAVNARFFSWIISIVILIPILGLLRTFDQSILLLLVIASMSEALTSLAESYYLENGQAAKVGLKQPSIMLIFLIGWCILGFSTDLLFLVMLWAMGSVLTAAWFFPFKQLQFKKPSFSAGVHTLKKASPYALLTSTSLVYARADQLLVSFYRGAAALGIYGAAYRYLEALSMLPSALTQNLFPEAAKVGRVNRSQLQQITLISAGVGLLLAITTFFAADLLTTTILGPEYAPAAQLVRIFSAVLLLFFINAPLATVVQSSNLVKKFVPWGVANTVINVLLNIILIPFFGMTAAAIIMIITEASGLLINLIFVKKVYASASST